MEKAWLIARRLAGRRPRGAGGRPLTLAALCLCLCGCIGELDTASVVHDLRILALRVDPPECYLGRDEAKFRLTALVADVENGALMTRGRHYRVSTCPAPEDDRCEGLEDELVLGEGTFDGETFAVDFEFTAAHTSLLEAALRADAYKGFGGLPVLLAVKVWSGERAEFAAKRVVLQLPGLSIEGAPANENPPPPRVIVGGRAIDGDTRVEISGRAVAIDVDPASREAKAPYLVPTFSGGTLQLNESWTYAWFTTRGAYAPEVTGGLNPISQADLPAGTALELGEEDEVGEFQSWVVLRDGRGGVSWARFSGFFTEAAADGSP